MGWFCQNRSSVHPDNMSKLILQKVINVVF